MIELKNITKKMPKARKNQGVVGIDLGVKSLAVINQKTAHLAEPRNNAKYIPSLRKCQLR